MKIKIKSIILCLASAISMQAYACPTCVGRITPQSPPFFTQEFHSNGKEISAGSKQEFGHAQFKKLLQNAQEKK